MELLKCALCVVVFLNYSKNRTHYLKQKNTTQEDVMFVIRKESKEHVMLYCRYYAVQRLGSEPNRYLC